MDDLYRQNVACSWCIHLLYDDILESLNFEVRKIASYLVCEIMHLNWCLGVIMCSFLLILYFEVLRLIPSWFEWWFLYPPPSFNDCFYILICIILSKGINYIRICFFFSHLSSSRTFEASDVFCSEFMSVAVCITVISNFINSYARYSSCSQEILEPLDRILCISLQLVFVINIVKSKSWSVSSSPFPVIQQRPHKISLYIASILSAHKAEKRLC